MNCKTMFMNWKIQFGKLSIFPKSIYRSDAILLKIYFFLIDKPTKKFMWKGKEPRIL